MICLPWLVKSDLQLWKEQGFSASVVWQRFPFRPVVVVSIAYCFFLGTSGLRKNKILESASVSLDFLGIFKQKYIKFLETLLLI